MLRLSLLQKLFHFAWNNQQLNGLFSENVNVTHCSDDSIHLGRGILAANESTSISDWISIGAKCTTQVTPISAQISLSTGWGAKLSFTCSLQHIPDGYLIITCKWNSLAEESYYRTPYCLCCSGHSSERWGRGSHLLRKSDERTEEHSVETLGISPLWLF